MTNDVLALSMDCTGRVLVVDDDATNRQLLRDLLEARGHEVVAAENGEVALRRVIEDQPDVVLLDVMMSGLDGFEVCRQLKNDPDTAPIPVLLVTALTDRSDRIEGIEAGANDFLSKPIDSRDLMLRVRNAIHVKHLHDKLEESYDQLRNLEHLRKDLTRWVVHDMKAPLGGILGYLELLKMEGQKLDEEQRGYITEAFGATKRALRMVNSLLDVSRLEENKMPVNRCECDLKAIAGHAVDEVQSMAHEKGIRIGVPKESVWAVCDAEMLRRVFTNLIENAVRYVPEGGEIHITLKQDDDDVRVEVRDNGPGIPPEYHEKIFEKFGQVEIRAEKKLFSTGLGLAFCRLAIQAHGGAIGVDSEAGKGSAFWFVLPGKWEGQKAEEGRGNAE